MTDQRLKDFKGDKRSKEYKALKELVASEQVNAKTINAVTDIQTEDDSILSPSVEITTEVKTQEELTEIHSNQSSGVGDTVEKVLEKTGVKKLVKWLSGGEDCGCDERKEKLNKMFPYRKPLCLTEQEHEYLSRFFGRQNQFEVTQSQQLGILKIYNRVLRHDRQPSNCPSCLRQIVADLTNIYDTYQDDEKA